MSTDNDSKSLPQEHAADTTDKVALFWEKYWKEAVDQDHNFQEKNGNNIDGVMLFAGLFSAVAAAFLATMTGSLQPSPSDTTNALLMMLVHSINNTAFADQDLGLPVWNGPSTAMVWSQALGYAALSASLLTALGAVLGKQWLGDFTEVRSGPLQERSRRRQQKLDGLTAWRFYFFVGALPTLIQLALLLFSISLSIFMWEINQTVGAVIAGATAIGMFFYLFITLASLISPSCPFHTPVSATIYGAIGTIMKSVEEIAEYWAWCTSQRRQKRPILSRGNRMMAYTIPVLFSPLVAIASAILLTILAAFSPLVILVARIRGRGALLQSRMKSYRSALRFNNLKLKLHHSLCLLRNSAWTARHYMRKVYLDPIPDPIYSDARSIAWLLETSTNSRSLTAAADFALDVKWPTDLDVSIPTEHLYSLFVRSIPESWPANDRALRLGKVFIFMLCHLSKGGGPQVWKPALERINNEARSALKRIKYEAGDKKSNADHDLPFILSIIAKLVSRKLSWKYAAVEVPDLCNVSQPLLSWLLQPLEIILQMEDKSPSHFFPEAHRTFTALDCPKELKATEPVQYWRTFEAYFNGVVRASGIDDDFKSEDQTECETDCLTRVLKRLKQLDISRASDAYHHLLGPLTVLSGVATVPYLQQTFKDSAIDHWVIEAFKEAVRRTDEKEENVWGFASCLMNMVIAVDALGPEVEASTKSSENGGQLAQSLSQRIDSKTLISYLLGAKAIHSATTSSKQTVYALSIVHANTDELPELASNPDFIDYIVFATGPKQDDSVRDIGLKVLIAASKHILHPYTIPKLESLATQSDLASFIRCAFLHEDPSTILKDLLHNDNVELNASLLRILVRGDPLDSLLKKLHERPNNIPEDEVHDLEIALVLSNNDGRKKLLFDHLDGSIAQMPLQNYKDTLVLPTTAIIGRLLRTNGPLSTSEDMLKAFLRPQFEELLYPAWGELDRLEGNPKMLGLLVDCTERWLSISGRARSSPESTLSLTLSRLAYALEQLGSESQALPRDIKGVVQRLYVRVRELV